MSESEINNEKIDEKEIEATLVDDMKSVWKKHAEKRAAKRAVKKQERAEARAEASFIARHKTEAIAGAIGAAVGAASTYWALNKTVTYEPETEPDILDIEPIVEETETTTE